jgi:hypothetical protein
MPLLDPKFLAAKGALIAALDTLKAAAEPLVKGSDEGLLEDPGDRLGECVEVASDESAKLRSNRFRIGIFGLVKAGKSTLINALAEEYVSEVDTLPATTAALHLVRRAGKPVIHYLPAAKRPSREADKAEVLRLLDEKGNPDNAERVDFVDYPVDLKYLEEDVVLVDTPGLGYLLKSISDRAGRELHESVHAVVLVLRIFGGQPWQRDVREFLAEAVQRVPRVFVALNCDERKPEEWGDEPFRRLTDRLTAELRESARTLRAALEDGRLTVHCLSALQAASGVLRMRTSPDPAEALRDLEHSRFPEFRRALTEFAGGDKRLWDDLRFRSRGLAERVASLRESVRATVLVHLRTALERAEAEVKENTDRLARLEAAVAEVRPAVALEVEDFLGDLADKCQVLTDEFFEESVQPAVDRWLGTSDTAAQLQKELERLTETWRPRLTEQLDKRRTGFSRRIALKVRSELFQRLGVAVEIEPDLPLDASAAGEAGEGPRMPSFDIAEDLAARLVGWGSWGLGGLAALLGWSLTDAESAGKAGVALVAGGVTLAATRLGLGGPVAAALRPALLDKPVPAAVKGFLREPANRRLTDLRTKMKRDLRESLAKRRDRLASAVADRLSASLEKRRAELAADWTAQRDRASARAARLKELDERMRAFTSAADSAVRAATDATEAAG